MQFVLGFAAGVFMAVSLTRLPHYIRFDDQPPTPLDWSPKLRTYRYGRLVENGR